MIHALYLGALIAYVLAGCALVPFHGDESTILYMSRDFDTLFLRGDLAHIEYHDPPPADDPEAATKQDLRVLNGVTSKYLYGMAWWLSGFTAHDLNQQWIWGADWAYNQSQNAIPGPTLLFIARWASGLLTALSVALVFVIGARAGGWRTAYVAAFIYTLTPAVLLNGRRAVFESALLMSTALLIYLVQRMSSKSATSVRTAIGHALILGITAGLTIASKHTDLLIVVAALAALILYPLLTHGLIRAIGAGLIAMGALVTAALMFLALNASWWSQPLAMPKIILDKRSALLDAQAVNFGPLDTPAKRLIALARESLSSPPQYYESDPKWADWIGTSIQQYQASGLAGFSGVVWTVTVGALAMGGLARGLLRWRRAGVFAVLCWLMVTAVGLYALTPLEWQRYYLPMAAPIAVVCGLMFMSDRRVSKVRNGFTAKTGTVR
ncbi:MAG: ArnT family glycosyltransferase [Aggregatilineales bacterium]